ncbi:AMP-binding protein [Parabacteroides sp. 52]|uniref:AMP-binding protein n=1 Tax=unclassified Parabacteroides TaxID=2649774 RepID=UPI0027BA4AB8|nr:AMP-binding protein [Parabacteroides sp. 52]
MIEGKIFSIAEIRRKANLQTEETALIWKNLYAFLLEWFNESPVITVQTSGSTGEPKQITVRKEQMKQSARLTCSYLNLKPGDKAFLCMPLQFIGGKMMVVRAITHGLDLWVTTPSGHPFSEKMPIVHLAAMTPMQVYNTLQVPEEAERLRAVENLLIGGGAIDGHLEEMLSSFPNPIYSTYGMTETLSHIALRRLNGTEASPYYKAFPSVKLSLSVEETLVIDAPLLSDDILTTNDRVQLLPDEKQFLILGRKDNVINSGGIKIQIEKIEEILRTVITVSFAITSVIHPQWGEAMVLFIEKEYDSSLPERISGILPKTQRPKHIWVTDNIPLTGTGKTDRAACKRLANEIFKSF